jgi:hypothetical protein
MKLVIPEPFGKCDEDILSIVGHSYRKLVVLVR